MASKKETELSITISTVDRATAKIKAINDRLEGMTKPFRDFGKALGELRESSGLDKVIGGFKGVGSAITDILGKLLVVGGVLGAAVAGLFKLVDGFDELGDRAESIGVSVDFLAQMRYAAERSGASIESLDSGLQGFSKSLGQARAGTGRMAGFLKKVSPTLLTQLKAAKSNEAAFDLLAGAMAKIEDPAKKAALAQATLGDASLAPLFAKGPKGIKELRERYLELAGSQEGAAKEAGAVDDAMKDLKASTDGIKAALVQGLAPALKVIVERLRDFFTENRARIAEWAASLGKRIPGAVSKLIDAVRSVINFIRPFVDSTTKLKAIALVLAGVIVGPLVTAIYGLGVALMTTPVGWIVAGLAAIGAAAYVLINHWDAVSEFFVDLWDTVADKFGWAAHIIKLVLWPITGMATLLIGAWSAVSTFFVDLWDGITGVFTKAWEIIKSIVDKVIGAVDTVKDAAGGIAKGITGAGAFDDLLARAEGGDVTSQSRSAIDAASGVASAARITVDFANAPRGTQVKADPQNTADVDTSVGYNLFAGGLP